MIRIRNKNAILELLQDEVNFEKITLAEDLKQDELTKAILLLASKKKIRIEKLPRRRMEKGRSGKNQEVLVGFLSSKNLWSLNDLLDDLYQKKEKPFFLLINRVEYPNNIGVIARTAFAAGANGLIFQGEEDQFFNEDTVHYSIGAIARIPLVKMNIFEALKRLQKEGIKTFSIQMNGSNYSKADLTGSVAFVLGAEGEGLSDKVSSRCYRTISIPMKRGIDSLNVAVSAAIIAYEKIRQEKNI